MTDFICENDIKLFKRTIKKGKFKDYLATELTADTKVEVYCAAIYQGYLDACRTLNGKNILQFNDSVSVKLANEISEYLNKESVKFDHRKLCKTLVDGIGEGKITYGQAQKIVNMAFKYLCCLSGAEEYRKKLSVCHMPLDSIMLEWLYRECMKNGKEIKRSKMSAWSAINDDPQNEEINGKYSYSFYVKKIKEIGGGKTPLQLDFENWGKMQLRLSAETFLKSLCDSSEEDAKINSMYLRELMDKDNVSLLKEIKDRVEDALDI